MIKHATVVFLLREYEVYMAMKTDKVGVGRYTGSGGKVEKNEAGQMLESFKDCAGRETFEEIGVIVMPRHLEKVAIITFLNQGETPETSSTFEVHFFTARQWLGDPIDSPEMKDGRWLNIADFMSRDTVSVPLMAADYLFLPLIFSGQKIIGHCAYAPGGQEVVEKWSHEVVENFAD